MGLSDPRPRRKAEVTHVVVNNTYCGYGQANAQQLAVLLTTE
jgi:hypothetical protein